MSANIFILVVLIQIRPIHNVEDVKWTTASLAEVKAVQFSTAQEDWCLSVIVPIFGGTFQHLTGVQRI